VKNRAKKEKGRGRRRGTKFLQCDLSPPATVQQIQNPRGKGNDNRQLRKCPRTETLRAEKESGAISRDGPEKRTVFISGGGFNLVAGSSRG